MIDGFQIFKFVSVSVLLFETPNSGLDISAKLTWISPWEPDRF